ncbi:SUKH-3 domain-containing protein [Actinoplanes sp. CA-142083]|uniref:SUKH-3 domain-containing protein n=1 Tax=Actinoplanes sp. CA-142083 TaxID=3239903 RepID=UPI003D90FD5C
MDVNDLVDSLRSLGFEVSAAAVDFLERFAFLRLTHEPSLLLHGEREFSWTLFDPTAVATSRDARTARQCSALAGKSLCPVGTDGFHFTIYIAGDGTFFAGRDASLFRYADSVDDLFRALRVGSRPTRLED